MGLEQFIGEEKIRVRSHALWEKDGRPEGRAEVHWRRAVTQLMAELERDWLAALEEHERSELVMPRPQVHEPPQRLQADRCDPDAIRKAA